MFGNEDGLPEAVFGSGKPLNFLQKLYELLNLAPNPFTDIIYWSTDSKQLVIANPDALAKEVLPKLFKHDKMASFGRQLNIYGFTRVYPGRQFKDHNGNLLDASVWAHPTLHRLSTQEEIRLIKRRAAPKLFRTRKLADGTVIRTRAGPEVEKRFREIKESMAIEKRMKQGWAISSVKSEYDQNGGNGGNSSGIPSPSGFSDVGMMADMESYRCPPLSYLPPTQMTSRSQSQQRRPMPDSPMSNLSALARRFTHQRSHSNFDRTHRPYQNRQRRNSESNILLSYQNNQKKVKQDHERRFYKEFWKNPPFSQDRRGSTSSSFALIMDPESAEGGAEKLPDLEVNVPQYFMDVDEEKVQIEQSERRKYVVSPDLAGLALRLESPGLELSWWGRKPMPGEE